jgi:hypothetical protein
MYEHTACTNTQHVRTHSMYEKRECARVLESVAECGCGCTRQPLYSCTIIIVQLHHYHCTAAPLSLYALHHYHCTAAPLSLYSCTIIIVQLHHYHYHYPHLREYNVFCITGAIARGCPKARVVLFFSSLTTSASSSRCHRYTLSYTLSYASSSRACPGASASCLGA